MKMSKTVARIIIVVSLLIIATIAKASDSLRINDIDNRLKNLESYKNEVLDQKFETKAEALSNQVNQEVSKAKEEVIKAGDSINDKIWMFGIGGGIVVVILGAGFAMSLSNIKKSGEAMLKNKLEGHLSENSDYIIDMITSQKSENRIRKEKKILILAPNHEVSIRTTNLLKGMGFEDLNALEVSSYNELQNADLILFSNMDGLMDEALILEFMEKSGNDSSFIFYGKRLNHNGNADYAERLNFANSRHTLYHQIINTLTFKEIFKIIQND